LCVFGRVLCVGVFVGVWVKDQGCLLEGGELAMWAGVPTAVTRHRATFEEEALTPALLRSFRPWPKALLAALDELEIPAADAQAIAEALGGPSAQAQQAPAAAPAPAALTATPKALPTPPTPPPMRPHGGFVCCYINLASRKDRRAAMEACLAEAGLAEAERVEAVMGADVATSVVVTHWDTTLNARFDRNCTVQKALAMSAGERGCGASHVKLWERCVASGVPLLVLEDDLHFSRTYAGGALPPVATSVRALVSAIEAGLEPAERTFLLYLGAEAEVRKGSPSLRGQQASWAARAVSGVVPCALREAEWAWQTHAYVVWPQAAAVLLAGLPMDAPVDVYLSRHFHQRTLCGLVCEPILATQIDPYHGGDVEHSSLADRPAMGPFDYGRQRERRQTALRRGLAS
jgi:hypothetical protein